MRQRALFLVPAAILIGVGGILAPASGFDASPPLRMPTQARLILSSSFGEYRSGHYHGGIDFSTNGGVGVPIQAPGDGWVYRVRTSGVGYGRAVYFRLEDGRTVLFAHLSRFHPAIQTVVTAVQDRLGRYEADHYPPAQTLAFRAGEILGYSGQSGAGPPHLHAEVRTGSDASVAINPQGSIWNIPDRVPPLLTRVLIEPGRAGVQVNGAVDAVVIDLDHPGPLEISGPVRLWVESSDFGQGPGYRMAPRRVTWEIDQRMVSKVSFDRFHWNWAREVEWTFHNPRARERNERWICLVPAPRARQSIGRWIWGEDWVTDLAFGPHEMTFTAIDPAGNRTRAVLPFKLVAAQPRITAPRGAFDRDFMLRSRGRFLDLWVGKTGGEPGDVISISPDGEPHPGLWHRTRAGSGWLYQLQDPAPLVPGLWIFQVGGVRRSSHAVWVSGSEETGRNDPRPMEVTVELQGQSLEMNIPPGATYGAQWITLDTEPVPAPVPELEPVSPVIRLGPWASPLRERIRVEIEGGTGGDGLVLCSFDGESWSYQGAEVEGGTVSGTLSRLESLAVFRDTDPPRIIPSSPLYNQDENTLRVEIQEEGAGVVWRDLTMNLDGKPVIAEWDPDSGSLIGHLRASLAPGEHRIQVVAADRAGNTSRKSVNFLVR